MRVGGSWGREWETRKDRVAEEWQKNEAVGVRERELRKWKQGDREMERWEEEGGKRRRRDREEGKREEHGVRGWIEAGIGLPRAWRCSAHSSGWVNVCKTNQTKLCPQRAQGTQPRSFQRGLSFKAHCRQECYLKTGYCLSPLKEDLRGAS